jgi:hypothetical protein
MLVKGVAAYYSNGISDKEEKFLNIHTRARCYKTFLSVIYEFS